MQNRCFATLPGPQSPNYLKDKPLRLLPAHAVVRTSGKLVAIRMKGHLPLDCTLASFIERFVWRGKQYEIA